MIDTVEFYRYEINFKLKPANTWFARAEQMPY
jgi:hypothetical protein